MPLVAERNCYFDLIYFSKDSQILDAPTPIEFRDVNIWALIFCLLLNLNRLSRLQPRSLYSYTIPNLKFGEEFMVGIRTVNIMNMLESSLQWLVLHVPSCLDWSHYNYTLCRKWK